MIVMLSVRNSVSL